MVFVPLSLDNRSIDFSTAVSGKGQIAKPTVAAQKAGSKSLLKTLTGAVLLFLIKPCERCGEEKWDVTTATLKSIDTLSGEQLLED